MNQKRSHRGSVKQFLTKNFIAGLSVLIPLYFTVYILEVIVRWFDKFVNILPAPWRPDTALFPGFGLLVAFVIATTAGILVRNYFGKILLQYFNRLVEKIPLVASLYSLLRQISEVLLGEEAKNFNRVALVEWPRRDCWSIAFVTSEASANLTQKLPTSEKSESYLNVFLPTTPNPTSGFYFMVKESDTRPIDLTVDQAFKMIISAGTVSTDTLSKSMASLAK